MDKSLMQMHLANLLRMPDRQRAAYLRSIEDADMRTALSVALHNNLVALLIERMECDA